MEPSDLDNLRKVLKEELPRILRGEPGHAMRSGMMLETFPSQEETTRIHDELREFRDETGSDSMESIGVSIRLTSALKGKPAFRSG
jgi:hypothetical protein